jgi:hypothetical protein
MKHDPAVSDAPFGSPRTLVTGEPVFYKQFIMRIGLSGIQMSELPPETIKIIIGNFQNPIRNTEYIFIVLIEGMTGYLNVPSGQVLPVK